MPYKITDQTIYSGRPAAEGEYLYQTIKSIDLAKAKSLGEQFAAPHFGLLGYGVDYGVALNLGRTGAAEGPDAFRKAWGKLSHPLHKPQITLGDFGNIICPDQDLVAAQKALGQGVAFMLSKGIQPLLVGGGHDMAYGHFLGIQKHLNTHSPQAVLGVINIDAHLDLRMPKPEGTSGTPFQQLSQELEQQKKPFHYCCVGLRETANPPSLLKRAEEIKACLINRDACQQENWKAVAASLDQFLAPLDHVYLSLDLDVFHSGIAPGCSAPSPMGIDAQFGRSLLRHILASRKVISMDIAELNPRFDMDGNTARLAAEMAYEWLVAPEQLSIP